jgi:hypothetical protein
MCIILWKTSLPYDTVLFFAQKFRRTNLFLSTETSARSPKHELVWEMLQYWELISVSAGKSHLAQILGLFLRVENIVGFGQFVWPLVTSYTAGIFETPMPLEVHEVAHDYSL